MSFISKTILLESSLALPLLPTDKQKNRMLCSFKFQFYFAVNKVSLYFPDPGPLLGPRYPALAPNLYLPALAPNLYLPALALSLYLTALTPNLYLQPLADNFYYQSRARACTYRPCPPNLYLLALAYCLYYRSGT